MPMPMPFASLPASASSNCRADPSDPAAATRRDRLLPAIGHDMIQNVAGDEDMRRGTHDPAAFPQHQFHQPTILPLLFAKANGVLLRHELREYPGADESQSFARLSVAVSDRLVGF